MDYKVSITQIFSEKNKICSQKMKDRTEPQIIKPIKYDGPDPNAPYLSFKSHYIDYGRFHMNFTNRWIYMVGMPILIWSLQGLLEYCQLKIVFRSPGIASRFPVSIGSYTQKELDRLDLLGGYESQVFPTVGDNQNPYIYDLNVVAMTIQNVAFIYMDPLIGVVCYYFNWVALGCIKRLFVQDSEPWPMLGEPDGPPRFEGYLIYYCLAIHILAWAAQIFGNAYLEQRAPAKSKTKILRALGLSKWVHFIDLIRMGPFFAVFEILNQKWDHLKKEREEFDDIIKADIAYER